MTYNGTLTAHGRTWPLYEREEERDGQRVLVLFMLPQDQEEMDRLSKDFRLL